MRDFGRLEAPGKLAPESHRSILAARLDAFDQAESLDKGLRIHIYQLRSRLTKYAACLLSRLSGPWRLTEVAGTKIGTPLASGSRASARNRRPGSISRARGRTVHNEALSFFICFGGLRQVS